MKPKHRLFPVLLVCIISTTVASAQVRTAIAYKYANLVYPGALLTLPNAINNANTIVGSYFDGSRALATLFSAATHTGHPAW